LSASSISNPLKKNQTKTKYQNLGLFTATHCSHITLCAG